MKKILNNSILSSLMPFLTGILFLLVSIQTSNAYAQPSVSLNNTQTRYPLGEAIELLEDPSGNLTLSDVTSKMYANQFRRSNDKIPNFGFTKSAFWIRFHCINNAMHSHRQWVVELGFPNMHYIDFYKPLSDGSYEVIHTGNLRPSDSREVDYLRYAFKLDLPAGSEKTFYMRFENDASMTLPLTIWSLEALYNNGLKTQLWMGVLMGILLIMFGYNLFIFISLKDPSYLYYTLTILFTFLFFLSFTGMAYRYIWPKLTWWNSISILLFNCAALISFLKFSDSFLNMKTRQTLLHLLIQMLLLILGVQVLLIPFVDYHYLISSTIIIQAFGLFLIIFVGFLSMRQGYRPARYFFFSSICFLVTGSFRAFVRLGWITSNWFTENGYTFGIVAGVWLLSLALADHIRLLRNETEKATTEINEKERKYQSIFENIQDIYYETTVDGVITEVSPSIEQVALYQRKEIIGKQINDIFINKSQRENFLRKILKEEKVTDFEVQLKDKDGSLHYISTISILIRDGSGNPVKIVGSLRDITEKKLLEDKLLQVEKMESISTLAGGIAHDFSNLLTAINGYAELGLLEHDEGHSCNRHFRSILSTGHRASNLTRQLLTFSRKQVIERRTIDINRIITDLNKMMSRLIEEDIFIETRLKQNIKKIKADPGQIEQILINLIVNARDAIKQREDMFEKNIIIKTNEIEIDDSNRIHHPDSDKGIYVILSVQDTGIGIGNNEKHKIFEPFFTTKEKGKGTGLGLSTIYGIVKQNRGSIEVDSQLNEGTTFKIYWPAYDEEIREEPKMAISNSEFSGSEIILLVEDDSGARDFTKKVLQKYGYTVYESDNGANALKMVKKNNLSIDMLLTDFIMPEMNGMQLSRSMEKVFPKIRVLFTSGYADEEIFHDGVLEEGIHFIQKPFTVVSLVQKVRDVLDGT